MKQDVTEHVNEARRDVRKKAKRDADKVINKRMLSPQAKENYDNIVWNSDKEKHKGDCKNCENCDCDHRK
jgi:hypothetical protein